MSDSDAVPSVDSGWTVTEPGTSGDGGAAKGNGRRTKRGRTKTPEIAPANAAPEKKKKKVRHDVGPLLFLINRGELHSFCA